MYIHIIINIHNLYKYIKNNNYDILKKKNNKQQILLKICIYVNYAPF